MPDGRENGGKPAWSEEAEVSVLGAMLTDSDAPARAIEVLGDGREFYREAHRRIYRAASSLHDRGEKVDPVTLSDQLQAAGTLEAVGGMAKVAQLVDAAPSTDHIESYARVVRQKAAQRKLEDLLRQRLEAVSTVGTGELPSFLAETEDLLREVRKRASAGEGLEGIDVVSVAEALEDPDVLEPPSPVAPDLLYAGQCALVAGPPKGGKTTLLLAALAAISRGEPFLGSDTVRGTVLWLMGEGDRREIVRGLHEFGVDPDRAHVVMAGASPIEELQRVVEHFDPVAVVLDAWNSWTAPLELDNWRSDSVTRATRPVERIARESGTAIGAIHHTRKADDEPMDSQALQAWPDLLRIISDGDNASERKVEGRARFPVDSFRYRLVTGTEPKRVERVDPEREIEERILEHLEAQPDASKRSIRDGVSGGHGEIDRALEALVRQGIVDRDKSGRAHTHRIAEDPRGHA